MLLQNKTAVIYGAGGAVGGAVARAFAREGAAVFLTGRNLAAVDAVAEDIVAGVVSHAASLAGFVRLDMEGSEYTEATIAMTERLHAEFPAAVGTVLQASLYRTEADTERL